MKVILVVGKDNQSFIVKTLILTYNFINRIFTSITILI